MSTATCILITLVVLGDGLPTLDDTDTETVINKPFHINGNEEAAEDCFDNVFINDEFKERARTKLREIQEKIEHKDDKALNIRKKRDHDHGYHDEKVVVRCKSSYTGLLSFLAVPLLMGDIMIDFMNMIDISVNIEITTAATEATTTTAANNNNNNNNNNGGEAAEGEAGEGGNNNNNN